MLQKLDKFAPYVVLLIIGYLTYTTMEDPKSKPAESKALPQVTKRMLSPKPIVPKDRASPAGRDPFEVDWASYVNRSGPGAAKEHPTSKPATQPATAPATQPTTRPTAPPLTQRLMAVLISGDLRLAVIDGKVYEAGALIGGKDPNKCWQVKTIEKDKVVVQFNLSGASGPSENLQRVLTVAGHREQTAAPASGEEKEGKQ